MDDFFLKMMRFNCAVKMCVCARCREGTRDDDASSVLYNSLIEIVIIIIITFSRRGGIHLKRCTHVTLPKD